MKMPMFQSYNLTEYKKQVALLDEVKSFTYNNTEYTATGWGTTRYHSAIAYTITGVNANGETVTIRTSLAK